MHDRGSSRWDVFVLDADFGLLGLLDGMSIDEDGDAWGAVHCGALGGQARPVPLRRAEWWGGCYVRVACVRDLVLTAPEASEDPLIAAVEAEALREHYAPVRHDRQR
jgi:hypothetical protein